MNAGEILQHMAQKLGRCSSYQAVGTVDYESLGLAVDVEYEHVEFQIRFARPNLLHFESMHRGPLSGEWEPLALRCSGSTVHTTFRGRERQRDDSRDALAEVSHCTAPSAAELLAPLLMPELQDNWRGDGLLPERGPHLLQMKDLRFVGEEMRNGHNCFLVHGSLTRSKETTLWISARDFSLVRIYRVLGTAEEAVQRDRATAAREAELAQKLGRQAAPIEECIHRDHFVDHQFTQVCFDEPIDIERRY